MALRIVKLNIQAEFRQTLSPKRARLENEIIDFTVDEPTMQRAPEITSIAASALRVGNTQQARESKAAPTDRQTRSSTK